MRKRVTRGFLVASIVAAIVSPAQSRPKTSLSPDEILQLKQLVVEMAQAWKRHDADAYAAQFTDDAEHINAYGMWWRGRTEIASSMKFVLNKIYPANPISADQVSVQSLAKDLAVVQYRWQLRSYTDPDGTRHENPQGRITQVVVKEPAGWRIRYFQSTFINPHVRHTR